DPDEDISAVVGGASSGAAPAAPAAPSRPAPPAAPAPAPAAPARPAAPVPAHAAMPSAAPAVATAVLPAGRLRGSPLARKLAQRARIDLTRVSGTGPGGRDIQRDIEAF